MSKAINRIASDTGNPRLSAERQDTIRNRDAFLFVRGGGDCFVLKPGATRFMVVVGAGCAGEVSVRITTSNIGADAGGVGIFAQNLRLASFMKK